LVQKTTLVSVYKIDKILYTISLANNCKNKIYWILNKIEVEFRNVDFWGGRKTGEPGEREQSKGENQQQNQLI
jgi:hypothetical protein